MSKLEDTLQERSGQHGKFEDNAEITEKILAILRDSPNYHSLPALVKVGLWHIVHKIARACAGDWRHKDHWHDIGGYAKLVEDYVAPPDKVDAFVERLPAVPNFCDCDRPISDMGLPSHCITCSRRIQ